METVTARPQDLYQRIGNIQVRYWMEGDHGSPVVLIHGLGGYVETWWPNIWVLAREHRVYAVDLPGFGRSAKPPDGPYFASGFVQFLHDFLTEMGLEQASLVGHSLGGGIALHFTLSYPQMASRLVLVNSAALGSEVGLALRLCTLPLLGEYITRPSLKGSRELAESLIYDKTLILDEDVQFDFEINKSPGAQQAFLKTLRSLVTIAGQKRSFYGPVLEKLPSIQQPTLVIWGEDDQVTQIKQVEAARKIPNGQVHIFHHCRHMPQFEHMQKFDQAVLEFLCD